MCNDIANYLEKWLPAFEGNNRSYLTIAIGCTGGMHRSVYIAERLARYFNENYDNIQLRHRQLAGQAQPVSTTTQQTKHS